MPVDSERLYPFWQAKNTVTALFLFVCFTQRKHIVLGSRLKVQGYASRVLVCSSILRLDFLAQILGKAEFFNPGGSVKDRVALQILQEAFADGRLIAGGLVTEGTAGSTGTLLLVRKLTVSKPQSTTLSAA